MLRLHVLIISLALSQCAAHSQETLPAPIADAYASTLSALQSAKTPQDIHRMVEATDSADWVSVAPDGAKTSRPEAEQQLLGLLSIPAGQRPLPSQKVIYVANLQSRMLVVYWVYRITPQGPVGSMVRDTWSKTDEGWRREKHEKFFLDRPLVTP